MVGPRAPSWSQWAGGGGPQDERVAASPPRVDGQAVMCSRFFLLVVICVGWHAHTVAAWAWLPRWTSFAEGSAVTAFFPARFAQELERFLFQFFCSFVRVLDSVVAMSCFLHRCW